MNALHARILAFCHVPRTVEQITETIRCSRATIHMLVSRKYLINIAEHKQGHPGRYLAREGTEVLSPRRFEAPREIEQVSSVWAYAERIAHAHAAHG